MKDTATLAREKRQAEARKMIKECTIICVTITVLMIVIIVVGVRLS